MRTRVPGVVGWRLVVVSVVVGVGLAVASVPVCAFIAQFWLGFNGSGMLDRRIVVTDDGEVYNIGRRPGVLMAYHDVQAFPPGSAIARNFLKGPNAKPHQRLDPRPGFLQGPMPEGYGVAGGFSAGWPLHAGHTLDYMTIPPNSGSSHLGQHNARLAGRDVTIPLLPLWSGLAGNTVVYALLVFAPVVLVRGARRAHRRRRNRCVACGYDMSGSAGVCPECGTLDRRRMN